MNIDQAKLYPPKYNPGENRAARRSEACKAAFAELKKLEFVRTSEGSPADWVDNRKVLVLGLERSTGTLGAPTFQFDEGAPIKFVTEINSWLRDFYRQRPIWDGATLDCLVWWVVDHPKLKCPPVSLLGTDREAELMKIAKQQVISLLT